MSSVVPHEIFFNFAIDFLNHCEANKNWVKNRVYFGATCGYTGPGIGYIYCYTLLIIKQKY